MSESQKRTSLKASSLGISDIVFFVVAAAAPLGATLGAAPVVFAIGGQSAPLLYFIASIILMLFAVGFATMSRYVVSAGGFATLIQKGLGPKYGYGAAGIALIAYICMLTGLYGQFAAFGADLMSSTFHLSVPWQIVTIIALILVGFLGYLDIGVSAKLLALVLILEVLILLIFDIAVLLKTPIEGISFSGFDFSNLVFPSAGIALMFAFACFVGFESTTIYGEEAKNPTKTIPLATYIAITLIGVFYTFTTWCIGLAYKGEDVQALAQNDLINFVFNVNTKFVGAWSTYVMQVLVIASVFAVLLSFHNALCRYIFSLARSNFLPSTLHTVHKRYQSPHKASLALSFISLIIIILFILANADPIAHLYMWLVAVGTLGILVLQTLGALSVIGYFFKNQGANFWQGKLAPSLGFIGLFIVDALAVLNFQELTGTDNKFVALLPLLLIVATLLGVINGVMKNKTKN